MLFRTHLIIAIFFILLFFQQFFNSILFIGIFLFASIIPDIDSRFSKVGKHFRFFNFFVKHRGAIHSFSFLLILGIVFFFFAREILFPFVFGYSLHLILDGITIQGIRPFYPIKFRFKGFMKTGKIIEHVLFFIFVIADLFLIYCNVLRYI